MKLIFSKRIKFNFDDSGQYPETSNMTAYNYVAYCIDFVKYIDRKRYAL
jgi:hypothetical protein